MFDPAHGAFALALISALAFGTWLVSLWRRDVSIVDGMWPVFIGAAGGAYAALSPPAGITAVIALVLLGAWAVRLCLHIVVRNHGQPEDRRYQKIRARNQPNFAFKSLYLVFGLQAVLAWVVALPFMSLVRGPREASVLAVLALALAASGIAFEAVADWQLERFKKKASNGARVLDSGLWRYSRHPNYFGECCAWWGFGLAGFVTDPAGAWWALASPLLMTVLLLRVSGVSLLEKDIGERRPEYARYVRETNAFLPGAPRPARD